MRRLLLFLIASQALAYSAEPLSLPAASVASLDGTWQLAIDPQNVGRDQRWFEGPRPDAKPVRVPWIIQDAFPAYHGAAWFWLNFVPQPNPHAHGRFLLRFTSVDFSGEVWLNNQLVGKHEGAEAPFTLDVTDAIKVGESNLLSVRVMNPDNSPTDGLALHQTPRGARVVPYRSGGSYNAGGITGSVKLLTVPAVRIDELCVIPDPKTGIIQVETTIYNALDTTVASSCTFTVAPASAGETLATTAAEQSLPPGKSVIKSEVKVPQPRLWNLNDPFLYRVTATIDATEARARSETSTRCGFRDFRVENGYFRLNGKRLFVRSTHTTGAYPIGQSRPHDPDLARRDLINLKMMGFNMIRFIWGGSEQYLLDLCDEIGLMVYQESLASQPMEDSPRLGELFDASMEGVIRRDRNHPSVVIWGLLNEAQLPKHDMAFRHAASLLPLIRSLDNTRMVILNSGRFDNLTREKMNPAARMEMWQLAGRETPWVACNAAPASAEAATVERDFNPTNPGATAAAAPVLPPDQVVLQPGKNGEFSVVRWTSPESGTIDTSVRFKALDLSPGAAKISVWHNGTSLFSKDISSAGYPSASYSGQITLEKGDTLDFIVGGDASTALQAEIQLDGKSFDVRKDYSRTSNPSGPWSYGTLEKDSKFTLFSSLGTNGAIGSIANPGSAEWQDIVVDDHTYPRVPHTAGIIDMLRKKTGQSPVFLSEYGIGSAVDLWRVTRQFERFGKSESEEGQYYSERLKRYLLDWENWKLGELFARPEDFFMESLRKMAGQRTLGINAIRSNPNIIGYSLTSGIGDPVNCGEGLTTVFRELKPGAVDAVFEAFAPLRWCLFAEPVNIYRGDSIRLEAVIANEDALPPGEYPALFQVVGPANERIWEKRSNIVVPGSTGSGEPPLAFPVLDEAVKIDGPVGTYRFLATLETGGAPTGGEVRFYLDDRAQMPRVDSEVILFGEDPVLTKWLSAHGIKTRPFSKGTMRTREVILVGAQPPPDPSAAFAELARHIAQGSTAIFLDPSVFQKDGANMGWLPLANKGTFAEIKSWLYLKDEWAKRHPIFTGLPTGLMDPIFYREIIPDTAWIGLDAPTEAVAGAIKASEDYSSGLMVAVYPFGSGRFILNNLIIRENLDHHPAAERLLRNLLRYGAADVTKPATALPPTIGAQLQAIGYTTP